MVRTYRIRVREVIVFADHADVEVQAKSAAEAAHFVANAVENRDTGEGEVEFLVQSMLPNVQPPAVRFDPLNNEIGRRVYCTEIVAGQFPDGRPDPDADGPIAGDRPPAIVLPGIPDDAALLVERIDRLRDAEQLPSSNNPRIEERREAAIVDANRAIDAAVAEYRRRIAR